MKNKYELTIGSDPEFFASLNNFCIPPALLRLKYGVEPIDVYRKNSGFPHYIYYTENGITLLDDGAAFELTVPPVDLTNPNMLYEFIQTGYNWGKKLFDKYGLNFCPEPTINFDLTIFEKEHLKELKESTIFGCDKDWDAYDTEFVAQVFDVKKYPYRHAGGHFVIGTRNTELLNKLHTYIIPIIKLVSFTVGSIALINSPYPEQEVIRQNYYGKPGKHRTPDYGIEYRSPSVSWTMNESLYEKMFLAAEKAVELFLNPEVGSNLINKYEVEFRNAYKNTDVNTLEGIYSAVMNS